MSSDPIITIEGLGKRYVIRHAARRAKDYRSLSESLARGASTLARKLRPNSRVGRYEQHRWEEFWALRGVAFEVAEGDIIGIVGRNGAGKSTLLKLLSRISEPTEGRIRLRGRVASLLEVGTGFHPELTGRENIYLNGAILGMTRAEIRRNFDGIVAFAEVERFLDTPVKRYSSGMYVRLAFAVAAHLEPEILVVDEVLAVGDLAFQKKCLGKMDEVARREGRTVLFVSHNMATLAALCQRGIMLDEGRVAADGPMADVIGTYQHALLERHADSGADPAGQYSEEHGIGIRSPRAAVAEAPDGTSELRIEFVLHADNPFREVQIGIEIQTYNGVRIAELPPKMTGFIVENLTDPLHCVLTCRDVRRYLAGGDYTVRIFLRKPAEMLLSADDLVRFSLDPLDLYDLGTTFEQGRHGLVPLRFDFACEESAR
ncbi:MAG: lipopolysaccharide transport system ATP-binding protein [Candidatus Sumerlaeota bacterium]|nr:lipopolysaccharide transport system ATP-binding protein [Candidatus Sumerlaeota bacterium]